MTDLEFDRLPFILKPHHMREILGLGRNGMREWRRLHPETIFRRRGRKNGHGGGCYEYLKPAVAKLLRKC